jgi:hypothetical protein
VLGMRFGASAKGSRVGRRASLPELQGTNRRPVHSSCECACCYSHYSRDSESMGCHIAEGMGEYEVSASSRYLLPVSAKLCRRHCRRNAGSERSLSRGREAFSRARISIQHYNMYESIIKCGCVEDRAFGL